MILSMNSQDLLEGLNIVTRALSSRPAKQILEGVLISAEDNRILMRNIRELDAMGFDAIVMCQVSMRALLPDLKDTKTPILCSFFSGYGAVAEKLLEIAREGGPAAS